MKPSADHLRAAGLSAVVADWEREHGPITHEELRAVLRSWRQARRRAKKRQH